MQIVIQTHGKKFINKSDHFKTKITDEGKDKKFEITEVQNIDQENECDQGRTERRRKFWRNHDTGN